MSSKISSMRWHSAFMTVRTRLSASLYILLTLQFPFEQMWVCVLRQHDDKSERDSRKLLSWY